MDKLIVISTAKHHRLVFEYRGEVYRSVTALTVIQNAKGRASLIPAIRNLRKQYGHAIPSELLQKAVFHHHKYANYDNSPPKSIEQVYNQFCFNA